MAGRSLGPASQSSAHLLRWQTSRHFVSGGYTHRTDRRHLCQATKPPQCEMYDTCPMSSGLAGSSRYIEVQRLLAWHWKLVAFDTSSSFRVIFTGMHGQTFSIFSVRDCVSIVVKLLSFFSRNFVIVAVVTILVHFHVTHLVTHLRARVHELAHKRPT